MSTLVARRTKATLAVREPAGPRMVDFDAVGRLRLRAAARCRSALRTAAAVALICDAFEIVLAELRNCNAQDHDVDELQF